MKLPGTHDLGLGVAKVPGRDDLPGAVSPLALSALLAQENMLR